MNEGFQKVRVAAAQISPAFLDREGSTEIACHWIAEAARGGAELLSFGEAWLPAYPFWIFMGSPIYSAQFSRRLYENAVEIPSATTDRLCEAARKAGIHVVMGLTELWGGSLYLAQLFINDRGEIVGHRRKLKPTHWERAIWGEGDGSDFFVVPTSIGRLGALNCWEHLQPLNLFAMNAFGEQIHVAAWPAFAIYNRVDPSFTNEANLAASRAYAMATQTFVIHTSAVVDDATVELLCDDDDKRLLLESGGGQCAVINPLGAIISTPLSSTAQGLVFADCDFGVIASAKMSNDPAGHYQRGDVFQVHFNPAPRRPLVPRAAIAADPTTAASEDLPNIKHPPFSPAVKLPIVVDD
ncbi:Nitrilase [Rhizorhabdus wittichii RW1]|uniref:Nitrilase n=1 Tax=Rhizorhabdus wittichii (strain DSM 6014 / CCUG 31198 / JCM 15750 / NBRC 105917 / EY 4224 / RW1) TaxID=392499 RepID=A0A9J9LFW4_RHIWR|nr:Nitrilase [Rhizorhabdus wittichii RW1]